MEEKTVLEGNQLIAEFMGVKKNVYNEDQYISADFPGAVCVDTWNLKYHSSWDWLMPVVEKINGLKLKSTSGKFMVTCEICPRHTSFGRTNWFPGEGCTLVNRCNGQSMLENTYLACLDFIKWYNTQSK